VLKTQICLTRPAQL